MNQKKLRLVITEQAGFSIDEFKKALAASYAEVDMQLHDFAYMKSDTENICEYSILFDSEMDGFILRGDLLGTINDVKERYPYFSINSIVPC